MIEIHIKAHEDGKVEVSGPIGNEVVALRILCHAQMAVIQTSMQCAAGRITVPEGFVRPPMRPPHLNGDEDGKPV